MDRDSKLIAEAYDRVNGSIDRFENEGGPVREDGSEEFQPDVLEARNSDSDNTGKLCIKCGKGRYQETSIQDDIDGVLHCTYCGASASRYPYLKTKSPKLQKWSGRDGMLYTHSEAFPMITGNARKIAELHNKSLGL